MVVVRGAAAARARRGPALGNFVLMMGEDKVPAACMGGGSSDDFTRGGSRDATTAISHIFQSLAVGPLMRNLLSV